MGIITTATRMWLTKSLKPFAFTDEYDNHLHYEECENLGLYIHIPFCRRICDFCPYCKQIFDEKICDIYINSLLKEIELVGGTSSKKTITSLYFGGGSPALALDRVSEIIRCIDKYFVITEGIGLELHPSDITIENLNKLKDAGITKISIGVQSFSKKYLDILKRKPIDINKIKTALNSVKFETVSMDFIFALPNQTIDDLKNDIQTAFFIGANHIAIYPFIDFTFTKSNVKSMSKKEKHELLDKITIYCLQKGYTRDSIWTFSKNGNEKYSSMTRDNFLGFGASATTLLKKQFKINTFSVDEYIKRIKNNHLPTSLTLRFSLRQRMLYFLFWTAYSTKVSEEDFEKFFKIPLKKVYGFELLVARLFGFVKYKDKTYEMTLKGAFYYHYYENFYTLSYIDKMWGIMKKEAFPEKIQF